MVSLSVLYIITLPREKQILMKSIHECFFLPVDDKGNEIVSDESIIVCYGLGFVKEKRDNLASGVGG